VTVGPRARKVAEPVYLAGYLAGYLIGWLADWLIGWLGGWVAGWLGGWVAGWLTDRLAGWPGWLGGWLRWLGGWLGACLLAQVNPAYSLTWIFWEGSEGGGHGGLRGCNC